jgi:hypothetical protein
VIPRILYGVEVLNHTLTDIKKLERLQVQICKQIQGLPERTANLAAYSLLGVEPNSEYLFSSWHVVSLQFEIRWSFCLGVYFLEKSE